MKYLKQLGIIFLICLAGEIIVKLLPFSFSGSVMAMIILFALLILKVVKEDDIKETADYLLEMIAFFIIPGSVSVIQHLALIQQIFIPLLIICLAVSIVTFASCAFTIRIVTKLMNRMKGVK